ncbi:MAG TPA: 30S ribosomal protein S17 [Candidatus Woesearchaeota archaeon]|nr:30S ribosomal protein S17 [Candidatus Woesearchaeota archaeon]
MAKKTAAKPKEASGECKDPRCPVHGHVKTRGRVFEGIVASDKMAKSVTVKKERLYYYPKFNRYAKRFSTYKAHNPLCINARVGDFVRIAETRPLSKTKSFVVIEIIKKREDLS